MTSVSRPLRPGDLIVSAEPFAHLLEPELWGKRCHSCLEESDSLKRCSGCQTFHYCSTACQKKDWKSYHKLGECDFYKKAKETGITESWLNGESQYGLAFTLRIYLLCKKKPEMMDKPYTLIDGTTRNFRDLMTHKDEIKALKSGQMYTFMRRMTNIFVKTLIPDLDVDFFIECMCKKNVNSFGLEESFKVGSGLFIEASVFNHSCRPNAVRPYLGTKIVIRAIRDIPAGEPILLTYVPLVQPRELRQEKLNNYFFVCKCEQCLAGDGPGFAEKFKELERLQKRGKDAAPDQDARQEFVLQKRFLELYEQMSVIPYESCSAVNMMNVLQAATHMQRTPADMRYLRPLMSKTREHMLITHGSEHPMFQELQQVTQVLGNDIVI